MKTAAKGNYREKRVPLVCPVCGKKFSLMRSEYKKIKAAGVTPTNSRQCAQKLRHQNIYKKIAESVKVHLDKNGGLYTHEVIAHCGANRITVTNWLKEKGFVKPGGHMSRYWMKPDAPK